MLFKTKKEKNQDDAKMADLLEQNRSAKLPQIGDLLEGVVISAAKNEVKIDIPGLTMGVVRGKELRDESGDYSNLKNGDVVQATVLEVENEMGEIELSFRFAGHQRAWDNLRKIQEVKEPIIGKIIDANKGGLMVKVGNVNGFLPVSQLTTEKYPRIEGGDKNKILTHLRQFIGQDVKVKIIDANEKDDKLIVSEKAAWEEKQQVLLEKYPIGTRVKGKITGIVDFGAFVEFADGLEGLVHISELAWQRIDHPRDIVKVGDEVEAEIIGIDDSKISLSIKRLKNDPWLSAAEKYKIGQKVSGKVLKINPFGAFVELDNDIHALIHVSEMPADKKPENTFIVGQNYEFTIISVEAKEHRLGLSIKNDTSSATNNNKTEEEATKVKKTKKEKLIETNEMEQEISVKNE
jgi:small subunit ribosomal protein S1